MQPRVENEFADVSRLLAPRSVAVIGASERAGNVGGDTVARLVKFGFPGPVWPVGRSSATVAGLACYPDLGALPGVPDLVIFGIPADGLLDSIGECIRLGVRNGVAYAGGLGEAGPDGRALQDRIAALCRANDFKLCGPNCVGIINSAVPVTATFATALHDVEALKPGVISVVSQSGGLGTGFLALMYKAGFGLRHLISSGNEAVVSIPDYIHAVAQDEGTRVIAVYLEGATDAPKFARALGEARRRGKPVVVIKSGAGKSSARAALAHTGKLVGEDRVFDAVLQEMGAIRVYSVEEMGDVCMLIAGMRGGRLPEGPGVGIVTFGGGNGVLGADQCERAGLGVPALGPETVAALRPLLVPTATAGNPMDLTPSTAFRADSLARLPAAIDVLSVAEGVDAVMMVASSLAVKGTEIAQIVCDLWDRSAKPVCMAWHDTPRGIAERMTGHGVPVFDEVARAARALGRLAAYRALMQRPQRTVGAAPPPFDWAAHLPEGALPLVVSEDRCHHLLRAAGLPVAEGVLAQSAEEAVAAAETMGLPVALKGISPQVTHRAAAGLLAIDLRTADEVRETYERLAERARVAGVVLDGLYVQKMHKGGAELLVSAVRDPDFGPVVSCGAGGGLTELLDDVVIERAPFDHAVAAAMIERLRIRRHARDAEGPLPTGPAAAFVQRVSELAAVAPWPRFVLEVNPIKWSRDRAVAVDGLLIIEPA